PPWPVTSPAELFDWLRSFVAQLWMDDGTAGALLGTVPQDVELAADALFAAMGTEGPARARFRAFLSQPTVFRFVAAVQGFFDNGGTKAFVSLLGLPDITGSIAGDPTQGTGLCAFDDLEEVALLAAPGLSPAQQTEVLEACERARDRFAVLDGPAVCLDDHPMPSSDGGFGAMYVPWVTVARPPWLEGDHPVEVPQRLARRFRPPGEGEVAVPPAGHVAGLMARVDGERGVHKAPANEVVWGIRGLTQHIGAVAQGRYNQRGLNVIRRFEDRGIRVWGARTLATSANPSWRYVNVRRLFLMLEQSILGGSQWAVFEPNDQLLWTRLRRDVTAFLYRQWRAGALFGRTAEEAFFVQCDAETNPRSQIDAGVVQVRVGVCPVKPAEFVVFEIGQWDGGSSLSEG
ncbi:MAG: phage tail sheath family protein, partial [Myxococcales bacterium]|nr:phage tail sheath family protein [Myxococcales bacterium]